MITNIVNDIVWVGMLFWLVVGGFYLLLFAFEFATCMLDSYIALDRNGRDTVVSTVVATSLVIVALMGAISSL